MNPFLKNHLGIGSLVGAGIGAILGVGHIFISKCFGDGCGLERLSSVIGHALVGALVGGFLGWVVFLIRKGKT